MEGKLLLPLFLFVTVLAYKNQWRGLNRSLTFSILSIRLEMGGLLHGGIHAFIAFNKWGLLCITLVIKYIMLKVQRVL